MSRVLRGLVRTGFLQRAPDLPLAYWEFHADMLCPPCRKQLSETARQ